jgi:actin-related protein
MNTDPILVIDFGSGYVKAGFAGNDAPSLLFPTVIGKLRVNIAAGSSNAEPLIGEAAQTNPDVIPRRPIERGVVKGWNEFYSIVNYVYQSLDLKSENNNVLIARPSAVDPKQLEAITEHFIETLHAPSISFISSATLSLLSTGRVTGIVAECGFGVTNVVPVFESFGLEHARITSDLGGCDVDTYLKTLLKSIGMTENDNNAVHEVKEQLCYIRASPDQPDTDPVPYELPSGNRLTIGAERWRGTEVLFDPKLGTKDCMGLSTSISTSIGRCDAFLRRELLQNVVISGGSTMFPGMAERVEHDVHEATQSLAKVIAAPERKNGAWVGGSIFASTPVFEQFQIKKADWETQREKIFRQKSFM